LRFDGEERVPLKPLPELGEHTAEVLREWISYDDARIASLVAEGVIATG
jgi:crotonobetainyl-CoA:carnitine CoA-transferase CaiB-like acyl-CoA transferase